MDTEDDTVADLLSLVRTLVKNKRTKHEEEDLFKYSNGESHSYQSRAEVAGSSGTIDAFFESLGRRAWPDPLCTEANCNAIVEGISEVLDVNSRKHMYFFSIFLEALFKKQRHTLKSSIAENLLLKLSAGLSSHDVMYSEIGRAIALVAGNSTLKNSSIVDSIVTRILEDANKRDIRNSEGISRARGPLEASFYALSEFTLRGCLSTEQAVSTSNLCTLVIRKTLGSTTAERSDRIANLELLLSAVKTLGALSRENFSDCFLRMSIGLRSFLSTLRKLVFEQMFFQTFDIGPMVWKLAEGRRVSPRGSDSELSSDGEGEREVSMKSLIKQIRLQALTLLQAIVRQSPQEFLSHWQLFLETYAPTSHNSLASLFLRDSSRRIRYQAVLVVKSMVEASAGSFQLAVEPQRGSFIPISQSIGQLVISLHHSLIEASRKESHVGTLLLILQTLGSFATCTPYNKLSRGLITDLLEVSLVFLECEIIQARNEALIIIGNIFSSKGRVEELKCMICSESLFKVSTYSMALECAPRERTRSLFLQEELSILSLVSKGSGEDKSEDKARNIWLVCPIREILLRSLFAPATESAASAGSSRNPLVISTLIKIIRGYLACMESILPVLLSFVGKWIKECSEDERSEFRVQVFKLIGEIAVASSNIVSSTLDETESKESENTRSLEQTIWTCFHRTGLLSFIQDKQSAVRVAVVEAFACINDYVAENVLPVAFLNTLAVSMRITCSDEKVAVRAAACRALGKLVLLKKLQNDSLLFVDVARLLCESMYDKSLVVRRQGCWALANLADAIRGLDAALLRDLFEYLLPELLQVLVVASSDHERVRFNATRALGNICAVFSCGLEVPEEAAAKISGALALNVAYTRHKVRWNALYACGQFISSEVGSNEKKNLIRSITGELNEIIANCANYKVRIGAITLLSKIEDLSLFQQEIDSVVPVLLNSICSVDPSSDSLSSTEYRYAETLHSGIREFLLRLLLFLRANNPSSPTYHEIEKYAKQLEPNGVRIPQSDCKFKR